ncbi:hypothetical protein AB1N83_012992 [Pleurotus pulmonarius]
MYSQCGVWDPHKRGVEVWERFDAGYRAPQRRLLALRSEEVIPSSGTGLRPPIFNPPSTPALAHPSHPPIYTHSRRHTRQKSPPSPFENAHLTTGAERGKTKRKTAAAQLVPIAFHHPTYFIIIAQRTHHPPNPHHTLHSMCSGDFATRHHHALSP